MGFLSELFGKKKEGPFESYYENGQLKTKATYKDDERDGPLGLAYRDLVAHSDRL